MNARLERADAPGLGVARQHLDDVLARQQREAGLVLDRAASPARAAVSIAQLDVQLVAHVLHRDAVVVLHLADEVDHRCAPRRAACASASSLPGIFTATGTKYSARFSWK